MVWANRAAAELLGWPDHDLIGLPLVRLMPERFHEAHVTAFERYVATRQPHIMGRPVRVPAQRRDGTEILIELVLNPLPSQAGALVAASLRSVEERVELELRSAVVSRLLAVLAEGGSLAEVAPRVLGAIGETLGWDYAGLWVVDLTDRLLRFAASWDGPHGALPAFTRTSATLALGAGEGLPGRVWATGEPVWIRDLESDGNFPRRQAALAEELRAAFAFPVRAGARLLGVIELFSRQVREPDEQLLDAMAAIGEHLGRFIDHRLAEEAVQAGRQRLDLALEAGRLGTWEWDLRADVLHWSEHTERLLGLEGVSGDRAFAQMLELVHPGDRAVVEMAFRHATDGGDLRISYRIVVDGRQRWVEVTGRLLRDAAGREVLAGVVADVTERMEAQRQREELLARVQSAQERLAFLAEAGSLLSSSLDHQTTLGHVARLSVPRQADWCLIHGVSEQGEAHLLAVAHRAGGDVEAVHALHREHPEAVGRLFGLGDVLATGQGVLHAQVDEALLDTLATDERHRRALEQLSWRSVVVVPLEARGRILGALTWAIVGEDRRYGREDLEFAGQLARRSALAVDNARLYEDQATTARTLQESLLPPHLPVIPGLDVAADYQPAGRNQVAGDFYDLFPLRGETWGVVVGDVRGKGPAAATVTALARWTVRAAAMQASSPPRVLGLLNDALLRRNEEGEDPRFCTALFARVRPADDGLLITMAIGGHPLPLVLRRDGRVHELGEPGMLVGAFAEADWRAARDRLGPGDVLLCYTDGVTEARVRDGLFGEDRLREVLGGCAGLTAAEVVARVVKAVEEGAERTDDVVLLALRVRE